MAKHSLGRQILQPMEKLEYDDGDVLHFVNGGDQIRLLRDCYDDHDVLLIIHGGCDDQQSLAHASEIHGADFLRALFG